MCSRKLQIRKSKLQLSTRSKIKHIKYDLFKCQPYILSPIFTNNDVNLLHSLRGRMIDCKANFRGRHGNEVSCPLCDDGSVDDQPYILVCPKIVEKLSASEIAKNKGNMRIYSENSRNKKTQQFSSENAGNKEN